MIQLICDPACYAPLVLEGIAGKMLQCKYKTQQPKEDGPPEIVAVGISFHVESIISD